LKKLGEFVYDPILAARPSFREVISRPPYELDNQAIYIGEWSKDGLR
jgi:hypothetical protein